ncbi:MAG: hypothetical protein Q9214_007010, partial [Letrouitia sp. 1 TL-2023]
MEQNELLDARPDAQHELQQMQDLVRQYSILPPPPFGIELARSRPPGPRRHVVLLTGVIGAFGYHILGLLREKRDVQEVVCLVRAIDNDEAQIRVLNALRAYGQHGSMTAGSDLRLNPDALNLGLPRETYQGIAARITHVGYMAWRSSSRLNLPLENSTGDIKAWVYLLTLATSFPQDQAPPRFLFASSTSTVANTPLVEHPIREVVSTNPEDAAPFSYSRSKRVAEGVCSAVHHSTRLKNRIWILRVGQLRGNVEQG